MEEKKQKIDDLVGLYSSGSKTVDEWTFWSFDLFDNSGRVIEESDNRYDSYEEALEAALREAIKLIKK